MKVISVLTSLLLITLLFVEIDAANAVDCVLDCSVSFIEPSPGGNIGVTTNISGATVVTGPESASLSLGNTTGTFGLFVQASFIEPGQPPENGIGGVSDRVRWFDITSVGEQLVGSLITFESDMDGIGLPAGCGAAVCIPDIVESGGLQLAFSGIGGFFPPGVPRSLTVFVQSDRDSIPEPATLLLLASGFLGLICRAAWRGATHGPESIAGR